MVPDAVPEFISQRRRWLNGAFFAAVYSLIHFRQIWKTDHTIMRKILLHIEFVYQFISLMFTYFSLVSPLLALQLPDPPPAALRLCCNQDTHDTSRQTST